jgi:DNA-binding NtrC family response regulator
MTGHCEGSSRLTVIVVDDEPIVGRRLKPALEKRGIEVETFTDPIQALARLGERPVDVVVSDVKMTGLDGIALVQRVRESGAPTKVILITGFPSVDLEREALAKGAFDLIAKPFKSAELLAVITRAAIALGLAPPRTEEGDCEVGR